jgi:hypothetical protein
LDAIVVSGDAESEELLYSFLMSGEGVDGGMGG